MSHTVSSVPSLSDFLKALRRYPTRWVGPAVLLALLAGGAALLQQPTWEVSQALVLRNEAVHNPSGLGKFSHSDDMKLTQETIFEVLKSTGVLRNALVAVGPPADFAHEQAQWPRPTDLDDLRESFQLTPPKGAEFGRTEIFYLKLKTKDRERGIALASALCRELRNEFQRLREIKARSMIEELGKTVVLAQEDLRVATEKLAAMERQAGDDLAELRNLSENAATDSVLRRKAIDLENELRQAELALRTQDGLLQLVRESQRQDGQLLASPAQLLDSQPNLKRLIDTLADARLKTSTLAATLTDQHPLLRNARAAQAEAQRRLNDELETVARGIEVNRRIASDRIALLSTQLNEVRRRLTTLAALRSDYANVLADVRHRTQLLERAESDLADARGSLAGAATASLITPIGQPDGGTKPVSPGALLIVAAGLFGGLGIGLAIVFLTMPVATPVEAAEIPPQDVLADSTLPRPVRTPGRPRRMPQPVGSVSE